MRRLVAVTCMVVTAAGAGVSAVAIGVGSSPSSRSGAAETAVGSATKGKAVFASSCTGCHAGMGSRGGVGPTLKGMGRWNDAERAGNRRKAEGCRRVRGEHSEEVSPAGAPRLFSLWRRKSTGGVSDEVPRVVKRVAFDVPGPLPGGGTPCAVPSCSLLSTTDMVASIATPGGVLPTGGRGRRQSPPGVGRRPAPHPSG